MNELAGVEGTNTRGGGENHSTVVRTGAHRASGDTGSASGPRGPYLRITGGSARRRVPAATPARSAHHVGVRP